MACDLTTLQEDACESKIAALDYNRLLIVIAQSLCNSVSCNVDNVLEDACTSGIAALDDRRLLIVIAQSLCESGGGGGAGTNYNLDGVVDPTSNPSDITKTWTYTNTVTESFWVWPANGAAWVQIV
jgi:hypothetical protein